MATITEERYTRAVIVAFIMFMFAVLFGFVSAAMFPEPPSLFGLIFAVMFYSISASVTSRGLSYKMWSKTPWYGPDWVLDDVDTDEIAEEGSVEV